MLKQSKRMKKLLASDPAAAEKVDYRRRVGIARRDDDVPTALQLFADIQARDIDIGPEGFNALIALLTTFERQAEAEAVFTYMRSKHVPLTEATYVSMMRALALGTKQQKPEAAEALLDEMLTTGQRPRLRSYSPIVVGYAQQGKINAAFALYEKMLKQEIEPTEVELVGLLKACGEARREGGQEVEERFYRVMGEMQALVLEPGEGTWEAVEGWFKDIATPAGAGAGAAVKITRGVAIDEKGVCGGCGEVLDSIDLSPHASQELLTMVEELVLADAARAGDWARFKSWLEGGREGGQGQGPPEFDVVVDGANVGYFQMNYAQAPPHVNYEQISWVVEHFLRAGKKPLLVLHARHVDDRKVPPAYAGLVRGWRERGLLLVVPYRNNDDWFWLFTTVFKGGRTLLVTNDEMRDHHFQMLSQRTFLRWKERHQAYFSFGSHERGGGRSVKIEAPAVYSRCIQGPGARKEGGGEFWHLPKEGSEDWLCVQVRREGGEEGGK
jgi:pentatricopeptide repeat protein